MTAARCIRLLASHTIDAIERNVKSLMEIWKCLQILMEMLTDNFSKLRDFSETLAAEKCALQDDRARLQSRLQAFVFLCARVFVHLRVVMDKTGVIDLKKDTDMKPIVHTDRFLS